MSMSCRIYHGCNEPNYNNDEETHVSRKETKSLGLGGHAGISRLAMLFSVPTCNQKKKEELTLNMYPTYVCRR